MRRTRRLGGLFTLACLIGATLVIVGLAMPSGAATIDVTDPGDAGPGTLRAAMAQAASQAGDDEVVIAPGLATITLSSTIPYPAGALGTVTIVGNGNSVVGASFTALNNQDNESMTIQSLTVTCTSGCTAVNSNSAALVITDSTINGGINTNTGNLTITSTTVNGDVNTNTGNQTITSSTIDTGSAGDTAVNSSSGNVTIASSTLVGELNTSSGNIDLTDTKLNSLNSSNGNVSLLRSQIMGATGTGLNTGEGNISLDSSTVADSDDEGINTSSGMVSLVNSTITGNGDWGISAFESSVSVVYSTITHNGDGEDGNIGAGSLTSFGTVVTEATGGADNCDVGATTSNGYNYSDDATCGFSGTGDVESGVSPQLGALGANGGPTSTQLPTATSPLVDKVPAANCVGIPPQGILTDQRGLPRPGFSACDIGSVELQPAPPPPPPPGPPPPVVQQPTFTG